MRTWTREHRVELKYVAIGVALLAVLITLDRTEVLGNLDHAVVDVLDATEGLGAVGMFLLALVSNTAVFVQIPYTLPLLSAAIAGAGWVDMVVLGTAAGIGAGFGEIVKYHVAHRVLGKKPNLRRSRLYQWVERQAAEKPRHIKWIVFLWAGSVLPDDTVIIPLAMIKYGVRRIAFPLFLGKVFHNLLFAMIFFAVSDQAEDLVRGGLRIDLAFGLLVTFLLVVLYQVEKALRHEGAAIEDAAIAADTSPSD
jgi:membrane protein YqaA with SNARE-associated domain